MDFEGIRFSIEQYKEQQLKLFTTSSFQTHSLVLLHIISRIDNSIPVYFINTGYHFPETIRFKEQIANEFNLKVIDTQPATPKHMQKDASGRLLFTSDPGYCCYLNKVQPMEPVLQEHDVWINGVQARQSQVRQRFNEEEHANHNVIRFHPMLDWSGKDIHEYRKKYKLPKHPLEDQGYLSIGCEPCTRKIDAGMQERDGRWFGLNKTECGLNTDLVKNTK